MGFFAFSNRDPSSASSVDAATNFSIWHKVHIAPLRCLGCLSCGFRPRNKCPADLLLAYLADKWDVYECTFNIILDAYYQIVVHGFVRR